MSEFIEFNGPSPAQDHRSPSQTTQTTRATKYAGPTHEDKCPWVADEQPETAIMEYSNLAAARAAKARRIEDELRDSKKEIELPKTDAEKRPHVLRIMTAILRVDDPDMIDKPLWRAGEKRWKPAFAVQDFVDKIYSMEEIEMVAWELLEACCTRSKDILLVNENFRAFTNMDNIKTFESRLSAIVDGCSALCKQLLAPHFLYKFVDNPTREIGTKQRNSKSALQKAETIKKGKAVEQLEKAGQDAAHPLNRDTSVSESAASSSDLSDGESDDTDDKIAPTTTRRGRILLRGPESTTSVGKRSSFSRHAKRSREEDEFDSDSPLKDKMRSSFNEIERPRNRAHVLGNSGEALIMNPYRGPELDRTAVPTPYAWSAPASVHGNNGGAGVFPASQAYLHPRVKEPVGMNVYAHHGSGAIQPQPFQFPVQPPQFNLEMANPNMTPNDMRAGYVPQINNTFNPEFVHDSKISGQNGDAPESPGYYTSLLNEATFDGDNFDFADRSRAS